MPQSIYDLMVIYFSYLKPGFWLSPQMKQPDVIAASDDRRLAIWKRKGEKPMYTAYPGDFSWNPLSDLRRMQETMNHLFDTSTTAGRSNYPAVNMYAKDDGVLVTAELPGFDNDKIDITVHGDTLRIEGNIAEGDTEKADAWHRRERGRGQFARTIELPYRADPDSVNAWFNGGVLEIEMRRPEEDKPRRITVNE